MADFVAAPLRTVDGLWFGDPERCAAEVAARAQALDASKEVPLLLRSSYLGSCLPPRSLVRFVGMVQDMANPEYYVPGLPSAGAPCGLFRDNINANVPITPLAGVGGGKGGAKLAQRCPIYCVATPALTKWASDRLVSTFVSPPTMTGGVTVPAQRSKRGANDDDGDGDMVDDQLTRAKHQGEDEPAKTRRCAPTAESDRENNVVQAKAPPLGAASGGAEDVVECVARLYPGTGAEPKLNDLVEIVGVLGGDDACE